MESVTTKESNPALAALTKHKARSNRPQATVVNSVVAVERPKNEVTATSTTAPVEPPATPVIQKPETQPANTRNYEESYKHLKAHHDKTVHEQRLEIARLAEIAANANKPTIALPKNKEEMEAYRKQYPEAMDVFKTLALETIDEKSADLQQKLANMEKFQKDLAEKEAFKRLLDIHPDAQEIRDSAEFSTWFDEQPADIRNILTKSTDINAVAKQLTLYKLEVLGINPKEKKKAEAQSVVDDSLGVNISNRTEITAQKKIWTKTEVDQICSNYAMWEKYRVEIDEARREGRYDPTK